MNMASYFIYLAWEYYFYVLYIFIYDRIIWKESISFH